MKKTVILSLALSLTMGAAATTATDTTAVIPTSPTHPYTPPLFYLPPKKNQKKFGGMKKSSYLCTRNPK